MINSRSLGLVALLCTSVALAGCGGSDDGGDGAAKAPLKDGTFTVSLASDPGNLDPQMNATYAPAFLNAFAYEGLVSRVGEDIVPNLAASWEDSPTEVTYTLRDDVTCADGSPLTVETVAKNYEYIADPENQSPLLGGSVPVGTTVSSDAEANTVTVTVPTPSSFLLATTGSVPIVCEKGLADREYLAHHTDGTGLFPLSETVANDHYTFTRRDGYTWGADDTTSETVGVPKEVVVKVIANQTTAANLLLDGELSAAVSNGPDRQRLMSAGFDAVTSPGPLIQMWFNQLASRAPSDPKVREALSAALDVTQVAAIAGGEWGVPPTRLAAAAPSACSERTVPEEAPAPDPDAANALLDEAGWTMGSDGIRTKDGKPFTLKLVWDRDLGDPAAISSAAEFAVAAWKEIGIDAKAEEVTGAGIGEVLFQTSDYDVSWIPIVVSYPSHFMRFVSGPTPPDGTNFPNANIPGIEDKIAAANELTGTESCPAWDAIEKLYIDDHAVVPVVDSDNAILTKDATFRMNGLTIAAASIRMSE
jgi:peptide/nickel transport system substrate-binding protein